MLRRDANSILTLGVWGTEAGRRAEVVKVPKREDKVAKTDVDHAAVVAGILLSMSPNNM